MSQCCSLNPWLTLTASAKNLWWQNIQFDTPPHKRLAMHTNIVLGLGAWGNNPQIVIGGYREIIMSGLVRHALMRINSAAKSAGSALILRYDCGLVKRLWVDFRFTLAA